MPVNAAFQSALSNDIVTYHPELWFRVKFGIMDDPICYKLRVISTATGTPVKSYSPKSFPSFKESLNVTFSRIIDAHMFQKHFETSVHATLLLPWPAYSPYMSPIEHVWAYVARRLVRDRHPAASKHKLLLRIQAI
ncbi:uncharacterized protein TNCV_2429651 [Trichonephila clavipes]|nr:uncharacterized protein TNCV_2429651 [Trichonephila clavipes]